MTEVTQSDHRALGDAAASQARRRPRGEPIHERLWSQVDTSADCWLWTGTLNHKGYGRLSAWGRTIGAHRVSYQLAHPDQDITGLQVDHTCHNNSPSCPADNTCVHRRCVRPDHLELVDNATNTARSRNFMAARIAGVAEPATECPNGHEYTDENMLDAPGRRRCRSCYEAHKSRLRDYDLRPDVKARRAENQRQRMKDPVARARRTAHSRTPEAKAKAAARAQLPEVKARNAELARRRRARKAAAQTGSAQ